jgi:hypothetical protein
MGVGDCDTQQTDRGKRENPVLGKESGHLWRPLGVFKKKKHALSAGISKGGMIVRRSEVVVVHAGYYVN